MEGTAEKRLKTSWTVSDVFPGHDLDEKELQNPILERILENAPDFPQGQIVYESSKNTYLGIIPRIDSEFTEIQVSDCITVNANQSSEFISMTRQIGSVKSGVVLNTRLKSKSINKI